LGGKGIASAASSESRDLRERLGRGRIRRSGYTADCISGLERYKAAGEEVNQRKCPSINLCIPHGRRCYDRGKQDVSGRTHGHSRHIPERSPSSLVPPLLCNRLG
jgi:hypothetical protein